MAVLDKAHFVNVQRLAQAVLSCSLIPQRLVTGLVRHIKVALDMVTSSDCLLQLHPDYHICHLHHTWQPRSCMLS